MLKKYLLLASLSLLSMNSIIAQNNQLNVFNKIVFYDGYATTKTSATPSGVVRLENSRYAKMLSSSDIANIQNTLNLKVTINSLCDNYDRQGGVFLAMVPKGSAITSTSKKTIEIGRFITPFMNKNVSPNEVTYEYELNHIVGMFKNTSFLQQYDIWVEFFLFGVPYAAQTQISGCTGREDVFEGSVDFVSTPSLNTFSPDASPKAFWSRLRMDNKNDSDFSGVAGRVYYFSNTEDLNNAYVQLITSSHGANSNGEEYVRRDHYVYFDDVEVLTYKPGGLSCEPFRKYNTQANGIYGSSVKSDASWASWNNWCPGDKIPNRIINLGTVAPGNHEFKLSVPLGRFVNSNDEIVISAFLFSEDNAVLSNKKIASIDYALYPNPTNDVLKIEANSEINQVRVFDINGKQLIVTKEVNIDISTLVKNTYIVQIEFNNGKKITEKIIKE